MSKGTVNFRSHAVVLGAFLAVFLLWLGYILFQSGTLPTVGKKYTVSAIVPTAELMTPGARVTMAGAQVGRVKSVKRASALGPGAKLVLQLTDKSVFPIPDDSRIQIRTRSQVGENYVSIIPGSDKTTIPDGGTLPVQAADEQVDVDQILSVLQGSTRERTRKLFEEFGGALTGRGPDLNRTIRGTAGFLGYGSQFVNALHREGQLVPRLVDQLGQVTAAVGDRGAAIQTIARQGVKSLQAIGSHDATLAATLHELPATVSQIKHTSATVGSVSRRAAPVVNALAQATAQLQPAIDRLSTTGAQSRTLVRQLNKGLPDLGHVALGASAAGRYIAKLAPDLKQTFCQFNPALRYLLPYKRDVLDILFHLGSGSHSYDATGHMVRLLPLVNDNSSSGLPPAALDAVHTLLQSGAVIPQKIINYDPYMAPGADGKAAATSAEPTGPASLKASGFKYPRVEADC